MKLTDRACAGVSSTVGEGGGGPDSGHGLRGGEGGVAKARAPDTPSPLSRPAVDADDKRSAPAADDGPAPLRAASASLCSMICFRRLAWKRRPSSVSRMEGSLM